MYLYRLVKYLWNVSRGWAGVSGIFYSGVCIHISMGVYSGPPCRGAGGLDMSLVSYKYPPPPLLCSPCCVYAAFQISVFVVVQSSVPSLIFKSSSCLCGWCIGWGGWLVCEMHCKKYSFSINSCNVYW